MPLNRATFNLTYIQYVNIIKKRLIPDCPAYLHQFVAILKDYTVVFSVPI